MPSSFVDVLRIIFVLYQSSNAYSLVTYGFGFLPSSLSNRATRRHNHQVPRSNIRQLLPRRLLRDSGGGRSSSSSNINRNNARRKKFDLLSASSSDNHNSGEITTDDINHNYDTNNANGFIERESPARERRKQRLVKRSLNKIFDAFPLTEQDEEEELALIPDAIFDKIDVDGDGVLTKQELSELGLQIYALSSIDADKSGCIDKQEFKNAVEKVKGNLKVDSGLRISGEKNEIDAIDAVEDIVDGLEDSLGSLAPLEREAFRLDGFEPYIFVSVLTAGAAFEGIRDIDDIDIGANSWDELFQLISSFSLSTPSEILLSQPDAWYVFGIVFSALGVTITGMYATVTFALVMLYGKTALGMQRDNEYKVFMTNTSSNRFTAFIAFGLSLFLFLGLSFLEAGHKLPTFLRLPFTGVCLTVLYLGRQQYTSILKAAAVIFDPTTDDATSGTSQLVSTVTKKEKKKDAKRTIKSEKE